jgi:hypothetical protein
MFNRFLRLAATFAVPTVGLACEQPCPSPPTWCGDELELSVMVPGSTPVAYELELIRDDADPVRCVVVMPPPEGWQGGLPAVCQGSGTATVSVEPTWDSGCSMGPDGYSCSVERTGVALSVRISGKPSSVELTLVRQGERLKPARVEPVYAEHRPDGPGCGAGCERSRVELSWEELTATE